MGQTASQSLIFSAQAYRFSDSMSVDILPRGAETECILHFSSELTSDEAERLVAAFRNEVLDQDLRSIIGKETEAVRNAILAYALSKTGLQGGE
jgi:His-Xaa-Ser system protein HxsD